MGYAVRQGLSSFYLGVAAGMASSTQAIDEAVTAAADSTWPPRRSGG